MAKARFGTETIFHLSMSPLPPPPSSYLFLAAAAVALFSLIASLYLYVGSKKAQLDHIPGPWLAKYTDAWRGYQAWRLNHYKDLSNYQINLIGRYGDLVRIGPNIVLCFDPEAISTIYGFKERLEKGPGYAVFVMTGVSQTALVGVRDEKTHSMYKRPIASTYSLSSLKGYEPYIDGMIEKFMGILDQHDASNEPINMSNWLHYWAFDMISKMSFGEPIGFLDHGSDFNGMIKSQKRFFRYISIVNNMPILDSLLKRNPFLKLVKQKPSMFFTFTKRIVTERIAQAEREKDKKEDPEAEASSPGPAAHHHRDMLGSFIEARKTYPQIMTDLRIAHLSTTNVVAGANDSASSMDKVIHYLAGHPDAQERLYNEITSVVNGTATAVKEKDSREKDKDSKTEGEGPAALELALKMPFLEAIVLESYRTFGVPSNNMERIVPQSGMRLPNGVQLPPGAVIAMNAASMAMLPHIFGADVKEFNPDRWFQAPTESDAEYASRRHAMDRAAGMVFGHGSRGCIGKNVVQLEMFKLWASLVRVYRFEPVDVQVHNVMVIPRRRERTCKEEGQGPKPIPMPI